MYFTVLSTDNESVNCLLMVFLSFKSWNRVKQPGTWIHQHFLLRIIQETKLPEYVYIRSNLDIVLRNDFSNSIRKINVVQSLYCIISVAICILLYIENGSFEYFLGATIGF